MLPALNVTPLDTASALIETTAEPGGAAFAAAIAQLRESTLTTPPAPDMPGIQTLEPATEDAAFVVAPISETPTGAIDWLLGQCTGPGMDATPVPAGDGAIEAAPTWSASTSTLLQMLALQPQADASTLRSAGAKDLPSLATGVISGTPTGLLAESALPNAADSKRTIEALWIDTLLDQNDQRVGAADESNSLESTKLGSQQVDAASPLQTGRAEATPKAATAALHTPIGTRAWKDELASKLTWLIDRGEQLASIRVTPDALGPIDIRIAVREGEASIWFGASQADTRQAIEQAIPRLREMLASQGLSLADAGVFQQAPNDPHEALLRHDLRRASQESGEIAPVASSVPPQRRGLIDDYA